jgi:DNA repair exonuclease SbcCD ATPase subunit
MILRQVTLDGFRTFRTKQTVELPKAPGLYLMRGVNEVDRNLAGNDVGKSTLWDAVFFGLYGETTRGLRAGQVVSWGCESAVVEQQWEVGGSLITVRRRQNPNGLWLDGKRVEQQAINEAIGLNSQEFLHCILVGQFTPYFLDLSPTAKLDMFSEVLGLSYWEDRSAAASKRATEFDSQAADLLGQLQTIKGRLDSLRSQEQEAERNSDLWQQRYEQERYEQKREMSQLQRREMAAEKALDEQRVLLRTASERVTKRTHNWQQFINEVSKLATAIDNLNKDLRLDRCPYCKRSLGEDWRDKLQDELAKLKAEHESATEGFKLARQGRESAVEREKVVNDEVRRLSSDLAELRGTIKAKRSACMEDENPYKQMLQSLRAEILTSNCDRRKLEADHAKVSTTQQRWKYWVRGFRDLRLWVLDSTLAELELRVNNSLVQLGLEDWTLRMAVERENKSGGISKGFIVNVRSPDSAEDAPWRGWGGGVTQRLRIAAEVGLSRLIADRKGIAPGMEVWDEPTAHLSDQGVQDLMVHLQARGQEEQKVIVVVDHRMLEFPFDGGMVVTKTKKGSTITFEQ